MDQNKDKEKILEIKSDRFFVKGCLNLTLKSLCPCSNCGYWNGEICEHPNPEGELDMYEIHKGRWEIMKFDIPHEPILLDVIGDGKGVDS